MTLLESETDFSFASYYSCLIVWLGFLLETRMTFEAKANTYIPGPWIPENLCKEVPSTILRRKNKCAIPSQDIVVILADKSRNVSF